MATIRIGTCSWKYPSWDGIVYSAPTGINYLAEYSAKYDTVEVDQWFWSLFGENIKMPNPKDVAEYRESVPNDFRFSVKVPNSITLSHHYKKAKSDPLNPNPYFLSPDLLSDFLTLLEPLDNVLGPIMFQFEYLNRQKMKSQKHFHGLLEGFIREVSTGFEFGMEIRNNNYLNSSWFEFLRIHNLIPVLMQGYWMPPVTDDFLKHRDLLLEFPTLVVRLHGPGRQDIEKLTGKKWNRIVAAKDEELAGIVAIVRELRENDVNVYMNVNNHYEGSAPITIRKINDLL